MGVLQRWPTTGTAHPLREPSKQLRLPEDLPGEETSLHSKPHMLSPLSLLFISSSHGIPTTWLHQSWHPGIQLENLQQCPNNPRQGQTPSGLQASHIDAVLCFPFWERLCPRCEVVSCLLQGSCGCRPPSFAQSCLLLQRCQRPAAHQICMGKGRGEGCRQRWRAGG